MKPIQLPVEIVARIVQMLVEGGNTEKHQQFQLLLPILQTSPTFRQEAERVLYASLTLRTVKQVVRCFTTISQRPHTARSVRTLIVHLHLNSSPDPHGFLNVLFPQILQPNPLRNRSLGRVLKSFSSLVQSTLKRFVNLQDYSLSFGHPHGRQEVPFASPWLTPNVPFQLLRFSVDLDISPPMKAFLLAQPGILDLFAPNFKTESIVNVLGAARSSQIAPSTSDVIPNAGEPEDAVVISEPIPTIAPAKQNRIVMKLRSLVTTSGVAAMLVPGRPLRRVCLRDMRRHDMTADHIVAAIPEVAKSSRPVRQFDVSVMDSLTITESLMEPIAMHLPGLYYLNIRRNISFETGTYDVYRSPAFLDPLSQLTELRHLVLPAPPAMQHLRLAGLAPDFDGQVPITFNTTINAQIFVGPGPPPFPAPAGPNTNNANPAGPQFTNLLPPNLGAVNLPPPVPAGNTGVGNVVPQPPGFIGPPPPPGFQVPHGPPPPPAPAMVPFGLNMFGGVGVMGPFVVNQAGNAPGNNNNANGNQNPPAGGALPAGFEMTWMEDHGPAPPPGAGAPPGFMHMFNFHQGPAGANPAPNVDGNAPPPPATQPAPVNITAGAPNAAPPPPLNPGAAQFGTAIVNHFLSAFGFPPVVPPAAGGDANTANPNPPANANPPPPPPGLPQFPMDITVDAFHTLLDGPPANGDPNDIPTPPRVPTPDPRKWDAISKGIKGLKSEELALLESWRLRCPKLKTVTFDTDPRWKTTWTWKESSSKIREVLDGEDGEESAVDAMVVDEEEVEKVGGGVWEVSYTVPRKPSRPASPEATATTTPA